MLSYTFLQQYWWFLVSLLGALLVFLMFVQGANSLIFRIGHTETERGTIIAITGRKWELTFTTLVTFGGAFFASFPLFYSTSFGGAYWVWVLLLVSFVLQAVAYEYQGKPNNLFGTTAYRCFLVFNGFVGPFVLGAAVSTFFTGSAFSVSHDAMAASLLSNASPVISQWDSAWHGLEALAQPWNWVLGLAVFFLARVLGALYLLNRTDQPQLQTRLRRQLLTDAVPFVLLFVAYVVFLLTASGLTYQPATQQFVAEPHKYLHNLLALPWVLVLFVVGVILVLYAIVSSVRRAAYRCGIWYAGPGVVLVVLALLLMAGLNNTAYYPSLTSPQSSLCLANSCSSQFTLGVMSVVSLLIPFVLAYIAYAWWSLERKRKP